MVSRAQERTWLCTWLAPGGNGIERKESVRLQNFESRKEVIVECNAEKACMGLSKRGMYYSVVIIFLQDRILI